MYIYEADRSVLLQSDGGRSEPEAPAPGSLAFYAGEGALAEPLTPGTPEWDAAWEAFIEWCSEQTWGPSSEYSGSEQFQHFVNKLTELGLPLLLPSIP